MSSNAWPLTIENPRARARIMLGFGHPRDAEADDVQRVTDYIAGMTDRFCIATFRRLALPEESRL